MKSDFDNPMVAGFGAATADDPPYPAQQHLDATDGQKTPDVQVREAASGRAHTVAADGTHVEGDGADGSGGDDPIAAAIAERDYEAKGVTKTHLEAEIDRRNEGRDESIRIDKVGTKAELVAALGRDDVIADAIADQDYEADGVTRAHLETEIDRRNATRDDADKISKDGDENDLIDGLQTDDDAA